MGVSPTAQGLRLPGLSLRWGALLSCATLLAANALAGADTASAAACHELVGRSSEASTRASVYLDLPTALVGHKLRPSELSVSQASRPVRVQSVDAVPPSRVDVALVLDVTAVPGRGYARARRLARSVLEGLPPGTRTAAVSAGGDPRVLAQLSDDLAQTAAALPREAQSRRPASADAVALAADLLGAAVDRVRHVVLVSTGSLDASERDIGVVRSDLERRGISLHATSVRGALDDTIWGAHCPATVGDGDVSAAAALLVRRLTGTYEVVLSGNDASTPLVLRVRSGAVDAGTRVGQPSSQAAVRGARVEPEVPGVDSRFGAVWMVAVLLVLGLVLVPTALLTRLSPALRARTALRGGRADAPNRSHVALGQPNHSADTPLASPDLGARSGTDATDDSVPAVEGESHAHVQGSSDAEEVPEHAERGVDTGRPPDELRVEGWMARVSLLSVLPMAVGLRLALGHGLPQGDSLTLWAGVVAGLLLAAWGAWWLWMATAPPYAIDPRRRRGGALSATRGPAVAALAPFWLAVLPAAVILFVV